MIIGISEYENSCGKVAMDKIVSTLGECDDQFVVSWNFVDDDNSRIFLNKDDASTCFHDKKMQLMNIGSDK